MVSAGKEWGLTDNERGLISAVFMSGMFLGSYVCGIYSDKKGRMFVFKKTMVLLIVSLALLLGSWDLTILLPSAALYGFATGGEITMGGVVLQEFCPPSKQY